MKLSQTPQFGFRLCPGQQIIHSSEMKNYIIKDQLDNNIGILLGRVLHTYPYIGIIFDKNTIKINFNTTNKHDFYKNFLQKIAGSFICYINYEKHISIYTDPIASIPIVYCLDSGIIASSANMLFDESEYWSRFDRKLYENLVGGRPGGWIPGTLTAHDRVCRLLPGHALDLKTMTQRRIWPSGDDFPGYRLAEDAAAPIALALSNYVAATAREHETGLGLTAGWDSRLLLAASKDCHDLVYYYTFVSGDGSPDTKIAMDIVKNQNLNHSFYEIQHADRDDRGAWTRYTGHCVNEVNQTIHPTLDLVPPRTIITGIAGETGRGFLYKNDYNSIDDLKLSSSDIIRRLNIASTTKVIDNIDMWLSGVSSLPNSMILDLAYLELRVAGWAMSQAPAQKAIRYSLAPLGHSEVQQNFMRLSPKDKINMNVFKNAVKILWPEISDYPINKFGDSRDITNTILKFLNPTKIKKQLRLKGFLR